MTVQSQQVFDTFNIYFSSILVYKHDASDALLCSFGCVACTYAISMRMLPRKHNSCAVFDDYFFDHGSNDHLFLPCCSMANPTVLPSYQVLLRHTCSFHCKLKHLVYV